MSAYIYLLRPFTPNGADAGIAAIQNYEAVHEGCDGTITVVTSRKMINGRAEGSWYESWKIKSACDEIHTFIIRFGVSPEAKAFVIEIDLVE